MSTISAQCPDVDAGPDDLACSIPSTFDLDGSIDGDYIDFFWTPDIDLSDPFSLNPSATISTTTTYCLVAQSIDYTVNLVENGDFEDGNTGFTTDYDFNATPSIPANEVEEGQYTVGSNPQPMHVNWQACGDHTSGSGEMLIANGDESPNQNVWCQTIAVTPNTDYAFSAWVASVDPNGPAEIQFQIDGFNIGDSNVAISTTCLWVNFFEIWNSGASSSITICIQDVNTAMPGNDFAVDDIVFSPICEVEDCVTLTVSDLNPTASNTSPICEGESFTLEATGGVDYDWSGPLGFSSSSNSITIDNATEEMSGTYYVEVTDALGCSDEVSTIVTVFRSDTVMVNTITCDPNMEGVFFENLQNIYFCDSMVTTIVEYIPPDFIEINATSCDPSDVGIVVLNLLNQYDCDSTVTIETLFAEADSTYINDFTCDSTLVSETILELTNSNGCDSLIFNTVSYIPVDSTFLYDESCDLNLIGSTEIVMQNSYGCDSLIITLIEQAPTDSTFLMDQTCDINLTGTFIDTLQNIEGCDSLIITEINLIAADSTFFFDQTCDPTLTGVFTDSLINQNGCDSLIITNISFISADSTYLFDQSCDINLTGTFIDLEINKDGCDSLIFTEVSLIPPDSTYLFNETCDPSMTGLIIDILQNQYGCDSLIFTETSLNGSDDVFLNELTCDPIEAGVFVQNLMNTNGCDSIVTTTIDLSPQDSSYIFLLTCDPMGEDFYEDILTNQYGCDSIIFTQIDYFTDLELSFVVNQPDCFNVNDGSIAVMATGGNGTYSYSLNGGPFQDSPSFNNLSNGEYEITVQDGDGCLVSDIFIINAILLVDVDLGEDMTISLGDGATIQSVVNIPIDSISMIEWTPLDDADCPNCLEQNVTPIITTSYQVQVTSSSGCTDTDQLTIYVELIKDIYIPNIISTNNDGINDEFLIFAKPGVVSKVNTFQGYDRWGNRLWGYADFLPNDKEYGWDGTFKKKEVNPGVYVWFAEIEFVDGSTAIFKGDVTVVK